MHTKEITPTALDEFALNQLFDALAVGEGTDLVPELARWTLQELIEAEAAEAIGADPGSAPASMNE